MKSLRLACWIACSFAAAVAAQPQAQLAADAVNRLGVALLAESRSMPGNTLLSPYSCQSALVMAYAGASGATRDELQRALFYPDDEDALHRSFAALRETLHELARDSASFAAEQTQRGFPRDPVALSVANRLFGQAGYPFREPFLDLLADLHHAPLQTCDFAGDHERERSAINRWVAEQTRDRIRDLIPGGGLNEETRLVLVNALYLKAPWTEPFDERATRPQPFWVDGVDPREVPTMARTGDFPARESAGYTAVAIPYDRGGLQFVAVVPDERDGLAAVEAALTADDWASFAHMPTREARVYVPKLRIEPPTMPLGEALRRLGARRAFDEPAGSADFDRMAPRRPNEYLFISEVFHKTFLALDEKGTEAAAATAVVMMRATAMPIQKPEPLLVRLDRPFLFAIQHRPSGACLFLGRVRDPR